MRIVADDKIPFLKGVLEKYAEVTYLPGNQITNQDLLSKDALLIRSVTICNEDLLKNTSIKLIATATIGDDHIDKEFCDQHNIRYINAKGCNTEAVVQYFTAGLLKIAGDNDINLLNKTIGIIGVGNIGKRIKEVSDLLGMNVLLNDPPRKRLEGTDEFVGLEEIKEIADIITLHVPLSFGGKDKTFHLFNHEFFSSLQKPVILINTSRGAVIDTIALKDAVEEGKVANCCLDVWESEPDIDEELLEMVDIATPHIAGYSLEGKANGTAMVVNEVSDFFNFEIKDWYPHISPGIHKLELNCSNFSDHEVIQKLFSEVYPIDRDDEKFRKNPGNFEILRREYNYRSENQNYLLRLAGASDKILQVFSGLGFQLNKSVTNFEN
jgi:erythronate-4-phosphate dehydrogenase